MQTTTPALSRSSHRATSPSRYFGASKGECSWSDPGRRRVSHVRGAEKGEGVGGKGGGRRRGFVFTGLSFAAPIRRSSNTSRHTPDGKPPTRPLPPSTRRPRKWTDCQEDEEASTAYPSRIILSLEGQGSVGADAREKREGEKRCELPSVKEWAQGWATKRRFDSSPNPNTEEILRLIILPRYLPRISL